MGETVVLSPGQTDKLIAIILESNPTLQTSDVDQIMGEIILGRTFRSQVCPRCGGRKRVITYPDGIGSPVWSDCECNPVCGQSSADRNPEEVELEDRVSMLVQELIGSERRADLAEQALYGLRLELQQARQLNLGLQEELRVREAHESSLAGLLRGACDLLKECVPLLRDGKPLVEGIEKFLGDR